MANDPTYPSPNSLVGEVVRDAAFDERGSELRRRFLVDLAAATQPLVDPSDVMRTTSRLLAEYLEVDRCAYAVVEDEQIFDITGDYPRGVASIVGRWPVAAFGPRCVRCMLAGEPYVVVDTHADLEITTDYLAAYEATEIRAVICVPLHKNGKFTAAMAVHQTRPRTWTPEEVVLVARVVSRCWEALERARVTRTLQESEARYRLMVNSSPECIALISSSGAFLQINQAGLRMIEATDEPSALGTCIYDMIAAEHRERYRAFNERICGGEAGTLEFDLVGLRGTRRIVETTAVPFTQAGGGHAQLATTRDVTARVSTERALSESRARLDYAVRLSGVGFWYCDLPFDDLVWDAHVKDHFFLPPDARVTIDTFYEHIHPDDRERTRSAIERSIESRLPYDVVYRTVHASTGAIKWVRALGGTAYDSHGNPSHFDGVTVDVTEQRRDQERIARMLEREQRQGRMLGQVAAAALSIHASDSVESVLRVVGEEARTIIGASKALTSLTDDASGAAPAFPAKGTLTASFVGKNGAKLGMIQLSAKAGAEFSELDEVILGQLAHIASVAIENARLYDQLREQDRRKDEFLATLAHELRNPLAPVRTGLGILSMPVDATRASKVREMMGRQLGHMVRMVDDLLDLSRVTLGKITLKKERVDLQSVVHSALETTSTLIDSAKHQFHVQLPEAAMLLEVDPTRLVQIVANLVNNAAKYTPAGGSITLTGEAHGDELVIRVIDTGTGIPAEMLPRVFELFTQVDGSKEYARGGLGIGLTLVRRLVELHDGSVHAESPGLGRGSTFTVRLPVLVDTHARAGAGGGAPASAAGAALRVLVVDDNIDSAETLGMLLELSGHVTRIAHTGPDALVAAAEFDPHVVFLDIGLPGLSGYEVAQRLRAKDAIIPRRLIALTGWGSKEDVSQAHAAGFDRHLVKPFDMAQLPELLRGIVARP